jgi:hypothetical protein
VDVSVNCTACPTVGNAGLKVNEALGVDDCLYGDPAWQAIIKILKEKRIIELFRGFKLFFNLLIIFFNILSEILILRHRIVDRLAPSS